MGKTALDAYAGHFLIKLGVFILTKRQTNVFSVKLQFYFIYESEEIIQKFM
jgi:hypothetical protein